VPVSLNKYIINAELIYRQPRPVRRNNTRASLIKRLNKRLSLDANCEGDASSCPGRNRGECVVEFPVARGSRGG
jgi:hypothetical protein